MDKSWDLYTRLFPGAQRKRYLQKNNKYFLPKNNQKNFFHFSLELLFHFPIQTHHTFFKTQHLVVLYHKKTQYLVYYSFYIINYTLTNVLPRDQTQHCKRKL